ncbi:MAG: C cytochrome precursor, partial [Verrucomicrobiota bacterium]
MFRKAFYLFTLGVLLAACSRDAEPVGPAKQLVERPVSESPDAVGAADGIPSDRPYEKLEPGFAGSDSCIECHKHEHQTWHASYHRTMTAEPTPETVKGNFDRQQAAAYGISCEMTHDAQGYYARIFDATKSQEVQIALMTGSHHMQMYWFPAGELRNLAILPVVYLMEAKRWIPRDAVFLEPLRYDHNFQVSQWSTICIRCHTTQPNPAFSWQSGQVFGPLAAMDTHVAEFGIACESCHGPAAEHVRLRLASGEAPDPDPIVLPTDLAPDRMSVVCGKCHGLSLLNPKREQQFYEHGRVLRPGMDLSDAGYTIWDQMNNRDHPEVVKRNAERPETVPMSFWGDGMIRVSGREYNGLINSPCFLHDNPEQQMSCMSCHTMHQGKKDPRPAKEWANDQLKPGMYGNPACLQCHDTYTDEAVLTAHTHHPADSLGSTCYNCHMPYTTYGLLKAIRSHTITSPSAQETQAHGRPNACSHCHLDRSLAWAGEHLQAWYGIEQPRFSPEETAVPASLVALYAGDAGQRALAAWAMGWADARETSGADWLARALMEVLNDPYHAVRYIAQQIGRAH